MEPALCAVVAPSHADNNKTFSTVGVPPDVRRVQLLDKIAVVNKTKSKEWSNKKLSQVEKVVGVEVLVMIKKGNKIETIIRIATIIITISLSILPSSTLVMVTSGLRLTV